MKVAIVTGAAKPESIGREVALRLLEPWPLKFVFDRIIIPSVDGTVVDTGAQAGRNDHHRDDDHDADRPADHSRPHDRGKREEEKRHEEASRASRPGGHRRRIIRRSGGKGNARAGLGRACHLRPVSQFRLQTLRVCRAFDGP